MDEQNRLLLRAELKRDESVVLKPYRDASGKLTIGTGRNLEDVEISANGNEYLLTGPSKLSRAIRLAQMMRSGQAP